MDSFGGFLREDTNSRQGPTDPCQSRALRILDKMKKRLSARQGSNLRPADYESAALPLSYGPGSTFHSPRRGDANA